MIVVGFSLPSASSAMSSPSCFLSPIAPPVAVKREGINGLSIRRTTDNITIVSSGERVVQLAREFWHDEDKKGRQRDTLRRDIRVVDVTRLRYLARRPIRKEKDQEVNLHYYTAPAPWR